jgi:circadian clock protein KaiB
MARIRGEMAKSLYVVRLYIAGDKGRSFRAAENLNKLLDSDMQVQYNLEVVDVSRNPALARKHDLTALPTIIRTLPTPVQKFVGNLSDENGVAVGFNLATDKPRAVKDAKTLKR